MSTIKQLQPLSIFGATTYTHDACGCKALVLPSVRGFGNFQTTNWSFKKSREIFQKVNAHQINSARFAFKVLPNDIVSFTLWSDRKKTDADIYKDNPNLIGALYYAIQGSIKAVRVQLFPYGSAFASQFAFVTHSSAPLKEWMQKEGLVIRETALGFFTARPGESCEHCKECPVVSAWETETSTRHRGFGDDAATLRESVLASL